jgi:hypothetical protein
VCVYCPVKYNALDKTIKAEQSIDQAFSVNVLENGNLENPEGGTRTARKYIRRMDGESG